MNTHPSTFLFAEMVNGHFKVTFNTLYSVTSNVFVRNGRITDTSDDVSKAWIGCHWGTFLSSFKGKISVREVKNWRVNPKPMPMSDFGRAVTACRMAHIEGHIISHGTARTIASMYCAGDLSASFASTGAITKPRRLWKELNDRFSTLDMYFTNQSVRTLFEALAVYILFHGKRGPVEGWKDMWVEG